MLREAIERGATVEEALQSACKVLGIDPADAQFEILQMPTKKTLGLFGGSCAIVRVYVKETPVTIAEKYLRQILNNMGIHDAELEAQESENTVIINILGDSASAIIGHHGETLDALQYLVGLAANRAEGEYCRISLNVGNYREHRTKALQNMAKNAAKKVLKTGRNYHFDPMNSYERRIIHTTIQEVHGVTSWSVGEDFNRHVVVGPTDKSAKPSSFRKKNPGKKRRINGEKPEKNTSPTVQNSESATANEPAEKPNYNFDDGQDLFSSLDKKPRKALDSPVVNSPTSYFGVADKLSSTPLYGRIDLNK